MCVFGINLKIYVNYFPWPSQSIIFATEIIREGSSLLGCYAMYTGIYLPTFRDQAFHEFLDWLFFKMYYVPWQHRKLFTSPHNVKRKKIWIFSNVAVSTSTSQQQAMNFLWRASWIFLWLSIRTFFRFCMLWIKWEQKRFKALRKQFFICWKMSRSRFDFRNSCNRTFWHIFPWFQDNTEMVLKFQVATANLSSSLL
jgi:hypothetical protein